MNQLMTLYFLLIETLLHASECTTIYLVRHGQTDWNNKGYVQSQEDLPLNETGKEQSIILAEKFRHVPFTAVYSSGMLRTNQTALILIRERPIKLLVDKRLVERAYGAWEGKPKKEYQLAKAEDKGDVELDSKVKQRAMESLTEIAKNNLGKNVLIVSHGAVLRNVITSLQGISSKSLKPENTGYVVLSYCDGQWSLSEMHGMTKR